jgi:hypothetical protein
MENLNSVCYVGVIGEIRPIEGDDNIELEMVDKEEIVASVTYTGCYDEQDRTKEPWSLEIVV